MSGRAVKRPRRDHSVVNVWERELGLLPNRNFSNRFSASEDLLRRLGLDKKLVKHKGCVNTVSFNADGDILLSGSDDKQVILWDWQTPTVKLSFDSGHFNNVFQAQFMPFSDDRSIVTSAADKQVRHSKILESGQVETCLLGKHQGPVHKLAVEPGSPFSFYTCGEDGVVKHFDLRTRVATNLFTCKEAKFNLVVYLHAIAVDPRNPGLFAVAGMDEYARVYDIRSYRSEGWYNFTQPVDHFCPDHLIGSDHVGITGLAFSDQSELLASYSDEFIYLFTPDMGLGPAPYPSSTKTQERRTTPTPPQVYKEHTNRETVKGVNFFGPKCEYVVSGSDCGRIFIWRKKDGECGQILQADKHVVNCVESHPHMPLMCSSGIETDIKIWTPGGTERPLSPGNAKQDLVSGTRWYHEYIVDDDDDDDSDDETSDESSDDDDDVGAEEAENGDADVGITNDDEDDDGEG
ncbi:PREDICTED: DDB1- and CUL4-associated factor 8-like [Camelina sativa]|uniref:DDB1- and CUL4-associated factor 8-like n=1 Tax=Camelina sativa TaxID=90675 RepID=A0ABM0TUS0_CAMSA|nr:PREDICTED: DDB1- and CUL4-associated factor 8-like [Camelina sativa]